MVSKSYIYCRIHVHMPRVVYMYLIKCSNEYVCVLVFVCVGSLCVLAVFMCVCTCAEYMCRWLSWDVLVL